MSAVVLALVIVIVIEDKGLQPLVLQTRFRRISTAEGSASSRGESSLPRRRARTRPLGMRAVIHGRDRENVAGLRALVREKPRAAGMLFVIVTVHPGKVI